MSDPLTEPTLVEKLTFTVIGSFVGSLCAIRVSPAEGAWDAIVRVSLGVMFSCCLCPIGCRFVVKWCGVTNPAILDTTIALGWLAGIGAWWLMHAVVAQFKKRSEPLLGAVLDAAIHHHNHEAEHKRDS